MLPKEKLSKTETRTGPVVTVFLVVVILTGAGGMLGQLLLLRELLVTFYGNELTLGIILGNWLLFEAFGALLGGRKFVNRLAGPLPLYLLLLLLYAVLLPTALYFSRGIVFSLFELVPGEALGVTQLLIATVILLAPVSMVHGALFPLGCRALQHDAVGQPVGKVYVYETLGTLLGGVVFTLLLANRYHSLELALALCLLHLFAALGLLCLNRTTHAGKALQITLVAVIVLLLSTFSYSSETLHQLSLSRQWRNQDVVYYGNSPYGNIVTVHSHGEYTFFYDGRPVMTVPAPDTAAIADYVHIVGAAHPQPQNALVLGSGLGGLLDELLKHPVQEVSCLELDPLLPEVVAAFPNPLTERELSDRRVRFKPLDGRLYLARTAKKYDLMLLGFISQDTLQTNRLYTGEFFALAREKLQHGGILAFALPGSDLLPDPQTVALNSSIYKTLKKHFAHVRTVPGALNIYLAAMEPFALTDAVLAERLQERELGDSFITKEYLDYRLDEQRQQRLEQHLHQAEVRLNHDFNPAAFFYAIAHWGVIFSPGSLDLLYIMEGVQLYHYLVLILIMMALLLLLRRRISRAAALSYAIWSSGAAGMAFDLLLVFVLQCLYGYVYQMIGLLIAAYMAGTFMGGLWGGRRSSTPRVTVLFKYLEAAVALLLLGFYGLALTLQQLAAHTADYLIALVIMGFALLAGFAVGAQFPVAAAILTQSKEDTGKTAGILYGADLLGGWVAGLLISIILFPLLGLWQTLVLLCCLKLSSLLAVSLGR